MQSGSVGIALLNSARGLGLSYLITTGNGQFTSGGRTIDVDPGPVLYVAAHEPHRFHDVTEDLTVLVFFGPAEGSLATS